MHYLIIGLLVVGLLLLYRQYRVQRRGMALLALSLAERKPFLSGNADRPRVNSDWEELRLAGNSLIEQFNQLDRHQSNQLTQLEAALGSLKEAVLIIDADNFIILANNALHEIFGRDGVILGQRVERVLHSAVFLEFLAEVREKKTSEHQEIEFVESDRSVWVEATGALIPDLDAPHGPWTLFVLHDITHLKRLEAVRKEFVANVSHELKTPLSSIKGYVETLVDDHETMAVEDRGRFLEVVQRNCDRLNLILEDLLELSRLESRRPDINLEIKDLNVWLAAQAPDLKNRIEAAGHRLVVDLPDESLPVEIDSFRVNQVIENLVDNARKYIPEGSTIVLGAAGAGDSVEFWVADDGPGISEADLPHIFERFYRVDRGRSRATGGTGLGLSIVRHITENHGGAVRADSEVGKGTRITIRLPRAASPEATGARRPGLFGQSPKHPSGDCFP